MASSHTITVYCGAGEKGAEIIALIEQAAARHHKNRSEFALYCMLEQLQREAQTAAKPVTDKSKK